jgi:transposase-like protein
MCTVPKPFPREFREDVIRVYRDSDSSMAQVAKDFGISASCLKRWLTIDERGSSSNWSPESSLQKMADTRRTSSTTSNAVTAYSDARNLSQDCRRVRARGPAARYRSWASC